MSLQFDTAVFAARPPKEDFATVAQVQQMVDDLRVELVAYVDSAVSSVYDFFNARFSSEVGDRAYTEQNYVTSDESVTSSIDTLDQNLNDEAVVNGDQNTDIYLLQQQVMSLEQRVLYLENYLIGSSLPGL